MSIKWLPNRWKVKMTICGWVPLTSLMQGVYSQSFLRSSYKHPTIMLWSSYDHLGTCKIALWLLYDHLRPCYDYPIIIWWSSNDYVMIIFWLSYGHLMVILWSSYNHRMIIVRSSYDHLSIILWTFYDHFTIILNHI